MPTGPRQVPVNPQPDAAERRLHIHGINEMPAGYDAEVADLFRDLRAATTLSETDLAARLGTRPDVVQALEQGALYALPPWAETCRVVNAYGALLNLDVRPLLRRIYAQLEAGIVELQPKQMPDVPVMAPPETRDYGFASGNNAGGHAQNPLDIPWPPQQAPQPQNARPQAQPGGAPQAPRPNVQAAPQPQWPGAHAPQAHPQAWPGQQPVPQQAPRPAPPPQRQGAPQQQRDGRAPQPHPHPQQAYAPRPQPQPQAHPQSQPQPQQPARAAPPPPPPPQPEARHPLDADFTAEPMGDTALPEPEEKKRRRPALLKWGLTALIISVVAFGLWFALSQAPNLSGPGAGTGESGALDPDDPRSRKADRLPDASQTPAQ